MKMIKNGYIVLATILSVAAATAQQVSYFNQGFLRQQNAAQDLAWLGINSSGFGSVTNFTASGFSPLFTSSVTTPNTYPHLSFTGISQSANLVYASPNGLAGIPSFRALVLSDLPALPVGGTVTNFTIGDLPPLFTSSVATPTYFPQVTFALTAQNNNTFLAGPNGGGPLAPTFRTIATGDLPSITSIVRGDVSANAPVLYDSVTGIFSMHVADASHDGYLSSTDWSAFNDKGSGTLTGLTNASFNIAPTVSMISTSNSPVPSLKSISAGGNVTLTDNGTNVVINAANSGSGASGIDQTMAYISPYSGTTNFNLDFTYPAQTFNTPSNMIVFNYSTNWGLDNTSRVANVFIQQTNFGRLIYFAGASTNWHLQPKPFFIPTGYGARLECSVFGPGESNVSVISFLDSVPTGSNTTATFSPMSIGAVKLWLDGSREVYQDEFTNTPAVDFSLVRGWRDLSAFVPCITNNNAIAMINRYHSPITSPYNVPSVEWNAGVGTMRSASFSATSGAMWAFVMYYGRGGGAVLDCTGTRFSCAPSEGGGNVSVFSSSSISGTGPRNTAWVLFAFLANGASSVIRTNGVQMVSGNPGTPAATAWFIASDNAASTTLSTFYVAEMLVMNTNLTAVQLTNVESYFYRKYPFWNPPTLQ